MSFPNFSVGDDTTTWFTPSGEFNRYEYIYEKAPAGKVQDAHTPVTFRNTSGVHFSIHEAALVDYAGMSLQRLRPGNFKAHLSRWSTDTRKTERTIQDALEDDTDRARTPRGFIQLRLLSINLNEPETRSADVLLGRSAPAR
jgi:alpha-glucosidase